MSKTLFVENLNIGQDFMEFFMVKSCSLKTGSNNKQYFDVILGDSSGEINGKKWDVNDDEALRLGQMKEGTIVKVKALVNEWNGTKQLKVMRIRELNPEDSIEMNDFIKAAPEPAQDMYDYIYSRAEAISDEGLKAMALKFLNDEKERLLYYPAAMRNHHAEMSGLLYHIKRMLMMGERACEVYTNLDRDWVVCGVILHDMEKLNEIQSNEYGVSPGYTFKGKLLGHIVMGVTRIKEMAEETGLDEEKTVMLQHMILSHHYEPDFGSPVRPMFPEAELLHYLDMVDAKMFDFEAALEPVSPGQFSERIRVLDNRMIYKSGFKDE